MSYKENFILEEHILLKIVGFKEKSFRFRFFFRSFFEASETIFKRLKL